MLVIVTLLITACSQDNGIGNTNLLDELQPISFNIVGNNVSRGGEIGPGNIRNQHFRVWAYSYKNWARNETPYMKDVDIHYDPNSNGGEWVYTYSSQKAYWPKDPYTTLNFYVECPATGEVRFFGSSNLQDTLVAPYRTNASILYNIKKSDGSIKNNDLMVAWAEDQQNKTVKWVDGYWDNDKQVYIQGKNDTIADRTKKVQLTFKHAMSELRFKITTANKATRAIVRSVTLGNVASLLSWHFTNTSSPYSSASISNGMANIPLTLDAALNGKVDIAKDTVMLNSETPLFLPPQYVTCGYQPPFATWTSWKNTNNNPEMYLALDCDVYLGEKKVWDGAQQGLLYLPFYVTGGAQQQWLNGKRYTYLINLSGGFDYDGKRVITTTNPINIEAKEE